MEKIHSLYEGDSIGSFMTVEIAHKNDFLNFNDSGVLFRENRDWKEIEITPETGLISFAETELENGTLLRYQGSFSLHGPVLAISQNLRSFLGRKAVLRLTSHNHETFVLGDPNNPVLITSNGSTGKRYTDRSQIDYSFSVDIPIK